MRSVRVRARGRGRGCRPLGSPPVTGENLRVPVRALGLVLGLAADRLLADPRRLHPVAGFGRLAGALERRCHRDHRAAGAAHALALVGGSALTGWLAQRAARRCGPAGEIAVTAAATWMVVGGTSLEREGQAMHRLLTDGDLAGARVRITHLCGRDPQVLDAAGLARATVESVAENTSDAVVAPVFWGALAGVPGLLGYRALNTLDAMIGHRSPRYARFGWAAARLDDVANLVPARLTAAALVVTARLHAGSVRGAWRVWRRDAAAHPSPNAGPVEAALAGAMRIRLGGATVYRGETEERGTLGEGPAAGPQDIGPAIRACRWAAAVACAGCLVPAAAGGVRFRRG